MNWMPKLNITVAFLLLCLAQIKLAFDLCRPSFLFPDTARVIPLQLNETNGR
jgi:hypothetical protein